MLANSAKTKIVSTALATDLETTSTSFESGSQTHGNQGDR